MRCGRIGARAASRRTIAIVSGLAPGSTACTWIVGNSTCGNGATGNARKAMIARERECNSQQRGSDRVSYEGFGEIHIGLRARSLPFPRLVLDLSRCRRKAIEVQEDHRRGV